METEKWMKKLFSFILLTHENTRRRDGFSMFSHFSTTFVNVSASLLAMVLFRCYRNFILKRMVKKHQMSKNPHASLKHARRDKKPIKKVFFRRTYVIKLRLDYVVSTVFAARFEVTRID